MAEYETSSASWNDELVSEKNCLMIEEIVNQTAEKEVDEVALIEDQLRLFIERPDPPSVPEADLRPGAFLYKVHRAWRSLGRGTGTAIASHTFRALKEELSRYEPKVRNLQPKLDGNAPLSKAEVELLLSVMLGTWYVRQDADGQWATYAFLFDTSQEADSNKSNNGTGVPEQLKLLVANLTYRLFERGDSIVLEEPVGVPPEIFFTDRGRESLALILPTKSQTIARLSPVNAYAGFSRLVGTFFEAASRRGAIGDNFPLLIWVLRLSPIRDNPEYHQSFHTLAVYAAALANWYLRLNRQRGEARNRSAEMWETIASRSAFVVHGLPPWHAGYEGENEANETAEIDEDLNELDGTFFLPHDLPVRFLKHDHVQRHNDHSFGITVSVERDTAPRARFNGRSIKYWLFPENPRAYLPETAETTGMPVFDAEGSPGSDFDLAYNAVFEAVSNHLGFDTSESSIMSKRTLNRKGWRVLLIDELHKVLGFSRTLLDHKQ